MAITSFPPNFKIATRCSILKIAKCTDVEQFLLYKFHIDMFKRRVIIIASHKQFQNTPQKVINSFYMNITFADII